MGAEEALFQKFGKEFRQGTQLFREGEPGREMFVLQTGKVAITKNVRGEEKVLAILGPGEFFGEMALISNRPRNASAKVEEDARLLVIDPKTFETMVRGNSEIAVRMIKKLADRLSAADTQLESFAMADPASRIVHHLVHACTDHGPQRDAACELKFPIKEKARLLGVDEPVVLHTLHRLERRGLISRDGELLSVGDVNRLKEFLQYLELKWKFGDL